MDDLALQTDKLENQGRGKIGQDAYHHLSKSIFAHKTGVQRGLPMKAEYESKQRLSIVSSSTVSFATRNMIDHLALSP